MYRKKGGKVAAREDILHHDAAANREIKFMLSNSCKKYFARPLTFFSFLKIRSCSNIFFPSRCDVQNTFNSPLFVLFVTVANKNKTQIKFSITLYSYQYLILFTGYILHMRSLSFSGKAICAGVTFAKLSK